MRKTLLPLLAVLIALLGANALAQPGPRQDMAIVRCSETNSLGTPIAAFTTNTTFPAVTLTSCVNGTGTSINKFVFACEGPVP